MLKNCFKFYLPRVSTTFRYKMGRPSVTGSSDFFLKRRGPVSIFSPFMAISLGALGTVYAANNSNFRDDHYNSLADVYEACSKSVVHLRLEIKTDDELQEKNLVSNGSGFIIKQDGSILTNAHVVYDMSVKSKLKIRYYDGTVIRGEVVCVDPLTDLAIVKPVNSNSNSNSKDIDFNKYPPVKFKNSGLRVGDSVFAVGSPYGLLNTVSAGIVSGLNRNRTDLSTFTKDSRVLYLQTDLHLFPGNSGGPIFDFEGKVVGISTVRSEAEGLSFAIQISSIHRVLDQMISVGKVRRAWLGFRGVSLNPEIVEQIESTRKQAELNTIKHGVLILKAYANSPAAAADILPGDVIVGINDRPIGDIVELLAILDESPIDQAAKLNLKRIILGASNDGSIISVECQIKPDEYDIFSRKDKDSNFL